MDTFEVSWASWTSPIAILPTPSSSSLLTNSRVVADNIKRGNNSSYWDGIALLKELAGILKVAAHRQAFSALLVNLQREFKAKRNFIKWLNEAFPTKEPPPK